jgi:hypothetical protein
MAPKRPPDGSTPKIIALNTLGPESRIIETCFFSVKQQQLQHTQRVRRVRERLMRRQHFNFAAEMKTCSGGKSHSNKKLALSPTMISNAAAPAILATALSPAVLTNAAAPAILAMARPLGLDALGAERAAAAENARHAGLLVENAHQLIAAGAYVIGRLSL